MALPLVTTPARRAAAAAAAIWLVIYVVVWATGQRFSTAYLDYGWQLVPWDVLSTDPIRSVWYLHIQPPGWNLVLGVSAWVSPFTDAITLQALMAAFGAVGAAFAALVARQLGLGEKAAVASSVVAMIHPEVLRGAFEPTYELPIAALLLVVVWGAGRASRRTGALVGVVVAVGAATAVVLTRSLYHPLWLLAVVAFVAWRSWGRVPWRRMVLVAVVPVVLIGAWMGKNELLFDRPTLSSWFGMNLQRAVIPVLDGDELQAMFEAGEVSDVAMIGPFGAYELYEPVMPPCAPSHGHRSVAEATRTTNEYSPNFNFECYLPVFDQAGKDAWAVIRAHPDVWLEGRLWSLRTTFAVSGSPSESESVVMRGLATAYSVLRVDVQGAISTLGWGTPIYGALVAKVDFGLLQVAAYVLLAGLAVWHLVVLLRRRSPDAEASTVIVVSGFVSTWTVVVGAVGELGEQARFRTMTDPLVWVVMVAWAVTAVQRFRSTRRASARTASPPVAPPG
jgi:hypothetical protein